MDTATILSLGMSFGSLAVSAIAVFIAWRAYRRDEPDVKFTKFDFVAPPEIQNTQLVVTVVNVGGREILLDGALLRLKSDGIIEVPKHSIQHKAVGYGGAIFFAAGEKIQVQFRVYRREGKPHEFCLQYLPSEVKEVVVVDTAGREYRKKVPRSLKRQMGGQWPPIATIK